MAPKVGDAANIGRVEGRPRAALRRHRAKASSEV
jgi:hypothetical protein